MAKLFANMYSFIFSAPFLVTMVLKTEAWNVKRSLVMAPGLLCQLMNAMICHLTQARHAMKYVVTHGE